ncbi:RES family NAD+ phosphorylase [Sphingomonas sp. KC8]|uniref:RES family NAD+ phosphorylase n=1 Tax=Sphingomonas sp. KC8 TaxID=1030157 RepID=UPI0002488F9B|nr:RES family NAD+ phosphorylase [Sphingomonas sp. KC8]ARS29286.1 hypothetical protein KC8_18595 [Sphingomonas sp. KC8]
MPASDATPQPSDFAPYAGTVWRLVEAQHRISTNRLAASAEDQALLEDLVDAVKPTMPAVARGLHYLLGTPFRYGHTTASRFRRAHERPGIFYASEHIATALAETAYWRLLFFSRSPGFTPPTTVVEHSAFTVPVNLARAIDLTDTRWLAHAARWNDPVDYAACQQLATQARQIGAQGLVYTSVRDPGRRRNLALFDPTGFAAPAPNIETTWHFRYEDGVLTTFAAFPSDTRYSFTFADFGITAP